ncbi:MAG: hypothetical protein QOF84_5489 [Streptomyces sp.]|nr:hypothetical protein [Streptomyces sp.]
MALAVACGLGTAWSLYPRGGVTLGDAILLAVAPVVLSAAWRWKHARTWLWFLALWWLATAFTELVTHDTVRHAVYALCRPLTVALSFCGALWALQHRTAVARAYIVTLVAGSMVAASLYPSANMRVDPWKYGYGPVVSLGVILLSAVLLSRGRRLAATLLLAAVALVSLVLGFRSEFIITALAASVGLLTAGRGPGRAWRRYLLTGGALCALTAVVYIGYGHLASDGELGPQQQMRWERQSRVEGGLLIGARPEIIASATVIAGWSPVGRGVSPRVDMETRTAFLQHLHGLGIKLHEGFDYYYFNRGLYLHSVLFQLWAEAGILVLPGLLFPMLVVLWALLAAIRAGSGPGTLAFCFLFSHLAWDTLFSPWPRLHAVYLGTAAAAAVLYLARQRGSVPVPTPLVSTPGKKELS